MNASFFTSARQIITLRYTGPNSLTFNRTVTCGSDGSYTDSYSRARHIFINLLSNQENARPEYYIVPAKDVYTKFARFENSKQRTNPTEAEIDDIVKRIDNNETAGFIVEETGISLKTIRNIAKNKNRRIRYDQGKGDDFPFCFYIRKKDEEQYRDKWKMLFSAS